VWSEGVWRNGRRDGRSVGRGSEVCVIGALECGCERNGGRRVEMSEGRRRRSGESGRVVGGVCWVEGV
jgi:hypothetical protein